MVKRRRLNKRLDAPHVRLYRWMLDSPAYLSLSCQARAVFAVMIGKIATGEIDDLTTDDGKNAAAVALGRMGGKARAEGMSAKRRKEIARKAAVKRWSK